jgi:hypothetical protein
MTDIQEWNTLKKLGLFTEVRPEEAGVGSSSSRLEGPSSDVGQFSGELLELVTRYLRPDRPFFLKKVTREFERQIITYALGLTHWNQKKAAEMLGLKLTTLNYWVHQLELSPGRGGLRRKRANTQNLDNQEQPEKENSAV